MDANKPHEHAHAHGVAAEPDRVSARLVVGFAIALTVVASVLAALMAVLFWRFDQSAKKFDARVVEEAGLQRQEAAVPPLPRLQVYPVRHWKDFQEAERERLETYGWMDKSTGAVHIPIERAMDLIAERGIGPLPPAPVVLPAAPVPHAEAQPEKKQ